MGSLGYRLFSSFFTVSEKEECHRVLRKYNHYFRMLSVPNQQVFIVRTLLFNKNMNFVALPGLRLTNEIQFVISSAFVQLTFGYSNFRLLSFKTIVVTPKEYSYANIPHYFTGDVNARFKKVTMTWPEVAHGFRYTSDAINLAIHEFGHCLVIENAKRAGFLKFFSDSKLYDWLEEARVQLEEVRQKDHQVLRKYAGTNLMELFAVSLESFFEEPHDFISKEKKLFKALCSLLNQDPRIVANPALSRPRGILSRMYVI
ncbi:zinc-dependent peptidase [Robertkochia aurantiaca]|uniref:zinc-dependent peptidase n=1 Tax=Robertkochia aurantiaca TaxID=2873700 RepID=UPI001CCB2AD1|nr:zinc-dependent peptidase [Robertkochia sp. 3YJGBD-33]